MRGQMEPWNGDVRARWVTPSYGTGWVDWSDSLNELVRCRKQGTTVTARGLCRRTSGTGMVAFTLPSGMWPTRQTFRWCLVQGVPASCYITTSGDVTMYASLTNGSFVSFDFEFDVDQP